MNTVIPIVKAGKRPRNHNKDEFILGKEVDKDMLINQLKSKEVDIYDDYMELVIEFGFLILFAECFVLAPIAILILNKIEKFSDLLKFKYNTRRPEFIRTKNIGMWYNILLAQSVIAIFTNLSLVVISSNDNIQMEYFRSIFTGGKDSFKLGFFVIEHGIILLLILLWICMGTVAPWVSLFLKRREYKLKSNKWKVLIEGLDYSQNN